MGNSWKYRPISGSKKKKYIYIKHTKNLTLHLKELGEKKRKWVPGVFEQRGCDVSWDRGAPILSYPSSNPKSLSILGHWIISKTFPGPLGMGLEGSWDLRVTWSVLMLVSLGWGFLCPRLWWEGGCPKLQTWCSMWLSLRWPAAPKARPRVEHCMELMGLEMPCADRSGTADHLLQQQVTSEPKVKNDHTTEVGQEGQFLPQ